MARFSAVLWGFITLYTLFYNRCHGFYGHDHDHHGHDFHEVESTFEPRSPCGDWTIYTNEKCVKLFVAGLSSWQEAERQCRVAASKDRSQLVTIKTLQEQQFLTHYLFEELAVVDNIWLGIKSEGGKWINQPRLRFSNFDKKDGDIRKSDCVQMTTGHDALTAPGTWTWAPCNKSNLVVCEKFQSWPTETFQQRFLEAKILYDDDMIDLKNEIRSLKRSERDNDDTIKKCGDDLADLKKEMALFKLNQEADNNNTKEMEPAKKTETAIPIGYVYIQLSFQLPPTDLWPNDVWKDVSSDYAGLFFRVTGGESAGMNQTQTENSPRLKSVMYAVGYDASTAQIAANGQWSQRVYSGSSQGDHYGLRFQVSGGEVRPTNQAVSVWQKIG